MKVNYNQWLKTQSAVCHFQCCAGIPTVFEVILSFNSLFQSHQHIGSGGLSLICKMMSLEHLEFWEARLPGKSCLPEFQPTGSDFSQGQGHMLSWISLGSWSMHIGCFLLSVCGFHPLLWLCDVWLSLANLSTPSYSFKYCKVLFGLCTLLSMLLVGTGRRYHCLSTQWIKATHPITISPALLVSMSHLAEC